VYTGLRLGELLGLQWEDVSFDEGVLHLRRQMTREGEVTLPKSASACAVSRCLWR
jgi:integrase